MRLMISLMFPLFLTTLISCSGGSQDSGGAKTTIKGVAMLGPVEHGEVQVFAVSADGELGEVLAAASTNADGEYEINIPQEKLAAVYEGTGNIVISLVSGTYTEEVSGEVVTIAPSAGIAAILPLPVGNIEAQENGATFDAQITPLTEIAFTKARGDIKLIMARVALAQQNMPEEQLAALGRFIENRDLTDEVKAIFKTLRKESIFRTSDYRRQSVKLAIDANFAVSRAFGIDSIVETRPDNPKSGGTDPKRIVYTIALAAISKLADEAGVDSRAITDAFSQRFSINDDFQNNGEGSAKVRDASGNEHTISAPSFVGLKDWAEKIARGEIALADGGRLDKIKVKLAFNDKPEKVATKDWEVTKAKVKAKSEDSRGSGDNSGKSGSKNSDRSGRSGESGSNGSGKDK